jgi:hypothetical protein
MANADGLDGCFVPEFEEESVIATSKAESGLRRLEPLHVAAARRKVSIGAMKDFEGGLAIDSAQIGTCFDQLIDNL